MSAVRFLPLVGMAPMPVTGKSATAVTTFASATIESLGVEAVIVGRPAIDAVPEAMRRIGRQKAFMLTSQSLHHGTSVIADLEHALGPQCVGCYAAVPAHTPRDAVVEAAAAVRCSGADVVVTVGGGSVTDAGKALLLAIAHGATTPEELGELRLGGTNKRALLQDLPLRCIAVPTTLSGGEFSSFAGVTDSKRKVKEPYGHRQCAPQIVVLDPAITVHTPEWLWLGTGMCAVDHAAEALCSRRANPYSTGLACSGLQMLYEGLLKCKETPHDLSSRQLCQLGMWQAAQAGTIAGAGASHAIGHSLGGGAGVPHGYTSCIMLPPVLEWNAADPAAKQGLARISAALGKPELTAAEAMRDLVQHLGLPMYLRDVGVGELHFDFLADAALHDRALGDNPQLVGKSDIIRILRLATGQGKHGLIATVLGDPKRWKVGDCTVTRIMEMETVGGQTGLLPGATNEVARSVKWLAPLFADEKGRMKFAIQVMVVDVPGGMRIAVDTCVGNDKHRPAMRNWHMRTGQFLQHMERAGIPRESVTHVFCTHLHTDHIGWNTMKVDGKWVPTFPNAQYLFGRSEFEYWSQGGRAGEGGSLGESIEEELHDSVKPVVEAGLSRLVDSNHVLFDCGGSRIYLRPTPGHTPGHTSLIIESCGAKAIITGDCFHHPLQLAKPELGTVADTDSAEAIRTRGNILREFCGTPALMFGTHFARPTVGVVVADGESYRLETDIPKHFALTIPGGRSSKL